MQARIFSDATVPKDAIRVSKDNPWNFKKGDKVRIDDGDKFRQVARVELILKQVNEKDRDQIHSSKWTGTDGNTVECEPVSELSYAWNIACGSTKLKIGFGLTIVLIVSSYFNAALTKEGILQFQLGRWRWLLFALTVASAIGTWAKDLW